MKALRELQNQQAPKIYDQKAWAKVDREMLQELLHLNPRQMDHQLIALQVRQQV
jgi:lysozyme family protein